MENPVRQVEANLSGRLRSCLCNVFAQCVLCNVHSATMCTSSTMCSNVQSAAERMYVLATFLHLRPPSKTTVVFIHFARHIQIQMQVLKSYIHTNHTQPRKHDKSIKKQNKIGCTDIFLWVGDVRVFRSRTRLDVERAGKIIMNLMSGAAEEAKTRNIKF